MTGFDHHIGVKTEAVCDRIWVVVTMYYHTLSLINKIAIIKSGTEKKVNFRKMMKIQ